MRYLLLTEERRDALKALTEAIAHLLRPPIASLPRVLHGALEVLARADRIRVAESSQPIEGRPKPLPLHDGGNGTPWDPSRSTAVRRLGSQDVDSREDHPRAVARRPRAGAAPR